MNAKSEAKVNMYRGVQQLCDNNLAVISIIPAFSNAYNSLKANNTAILSTASLETQIITGIAADKTEAKKVLCQSATDIAAIVFAYAHKEKDLALQQSVKYTYSDLIRIKDDLVAPTIQNIYNAANTRLALLADYGITATNLAALQAAIDAYSNSVPKPRTAKAVKLTHTSNIKQLMKETDDILKNQLDKLITNFKNTHPDFVTGYKNARVIIDPGTSATQIKGTIIDKDTQQPISSAQIQLEGQLLTAATNTKGQFVLKTIKNGTHAITVLKSGYQPLTISNIEVKLGKATTANASLTTAPDK